MARSGTEEVGAPAPTSRSMARSIGALCAAGGALAIVRAAITHFDGQHAALAGGAAVLALGVLLVLGVGDRLAPRWFHLVLASVQLAITVAYASGGDPSSDVRLFYLWTAPVACTFFLPATRSITSPSPERSSAAHSSSSTHRSARRCRCGR